MNNSLLKRLKFIIDCVNKQNSFKKLVLDCLQIFCFFFFAVLVTEPRALHMLGRHFTIELGLHSSGNILMPDVVLVQDIVYIKLLDTHSIPPAPFILCVYWGVGGHGMLTEVKVQLAGISFLFILMGSGDQSQAIKLSNKYLYLQSHLISPRATVLMYAL